MQRCGCLKNKSPRVLRESSPLSMTASRAGQCGVFESVLMYQGRRRFMAVGAKIRKVVVSPHRLYRWHLGYRHRCGRYGPFYFFLAQYGGGSLDSALFGGNFWHRADMSIECWPLERRLIRRVLWRSVERDFRRLCRVKRRRLRRYRRGGCYRRGRGGLSYFYRFAQRRGSLGTGLLGGHVVRRADILLALLALLARNFLASPYHNLETSRVKLNGFVVDMTDGCHHRAAMDAVAQLIWNGDRASPKSRPFETAINH